MRLRSQSEICNGKVPMSDRIVSPKPTEDEGKFELSLRPKRIDEYIGQDKVKENLKILIEAAKSRGEAIDHVLLYGPPGLGKTTLANILANEMHVAIKTTSGPAIERPGDLAAILTNLRAGDVLFIDEVHRLGRPVEEVLLGPLPMKIFRSTSSSAKVRARAVFACRCRALHSSARRRCTR